MNIMMSDTDHVISHLWSVTITSLYSVPLTDWYLCICYSVHAQIAKCMRMLCLCHPVMSSHDFLQNWILETGNRPTKMKVQ